MDNSEELMQQRLERLKAGDPLEVCLAGLTKEDAEALKLAAALIELPSPEQADEVVAAQKALVMEAAAKRVKSLPIDRSNSNGSAVSGLVNWFKTQFGWLFDNWQLAGGLAALLFLVFFVTWANIDRSGQSPLSASIQSGEKGESIAESPAESPGGTTEIADSQTDQGETAEIAAVPDSEMTLFVPLIYSPLQRGPEEATLTGLRGLVEVSVNEGEWKLVSANQSLAVGARVRTGKLSSARLLFFDGSQASIGPNSELSIDQLNARKPEEGLRFVELTLWEGDSDHQVQFRNDTGSRYLVRTPTGEGIARGTKFHVQVTDTEARYTVTEGRVDVSNANTTTRVLAGQTTYFAPDSAPATPDFLVTGIGEVTQTGDTWIIAGQSFDVISETVIIGNPEVGDIVRVEGHLVPGENPVADRIELLSAPEENRFRLTGIVELIDEDYWIVAGQNISVTAETEIESGIEVDDLVRVSGIIEVPGGNLVAEEIELIDDDPRMPFEFVGVVTDIVGDEWTISGVTIMTDGDTEIEDIIVPGDTVSVEGWILPDGTWLAKEIKKVDGGATFSFTGIVDSIDPWQVAGISFETRSWTLIEPDIEIGDLVRVSGIILNDGTWVASSIERIDDEVLQIVFVGTVDEMDPWVINGLPIDTDEETEIIGEIEEGDTVLVTALILADGTWYALEIEKLDLEIEEGCVTITAVITEINGDRIVFADGRTVLLDAGIVVDGELRVGSVVLIVACVNDGVIEIISITVIYTPIIIPPPPDVPPTPGGGNNKIVVCHKPNTPAEKNLSIPEPALGGHLGHGDIVGPCP